MTLLSLIFLFMNSISINNYYCSNYDVAELRDNGQFSENFIRFHEVYSLVKRHELKSATKLQSQYYVDYVDIRSYTLFDLNALLIVFEQKHNIQWTKERFDELLRCQEYEERFWILVEYVHFSINYLDELPEQYLLELSDDYADYLPGVLTILNLFDLESYSQEALNMLEPFREFSDCQSYDLAINFGMSHWYSGDHNEALEYLKRAYKIRPNASILHILGDVMMGVNDEESLEYYKNAVLFDPYDVFSYSGLLDFYFEKKNLEAYYATIDDFLEINSFSKESLLDAYPYLVLGREKMPGEEFYQKLNEHHLEQLVTHLKVIQMDYLKNINKEEVVNKFEGMGESGVKNYLLASIDSIWDYYELRFKGLSR